MPVPTHIFFNVPSLPIREKAAPETVPAAPLSGSLLGRLPGQQSSEDKCAEWVKYKAPTYQQMTGFAAPAFASFAGKRTVFRDEEDDNASMMSEATVRPARGAGPETSYFESDADDPTVMGDRDISDDEPDDVFIASAAKNWIFGSQSKGKYFLASDVKHKAALLTIERYWGAPLAKLIPAALRPIRAVPTAPGGRLTAANEMEWDKDMTLVLKKVARMSSLKEFELAIGEKIKQGTAPGLSQRWMTREDVKSFYESLKNRGRTPRSMADVARDGSKAAYGYGYFPATPAPR
ncbi:hypothetical protein LTR36_001865 [Oleoguttula mirabilis]|uniref:Uncharacterized protein n=1 Tax=Oleoguttula mirabilis TaxID=1507867 RepID=A0AAV9JM90_9PEZI|nr:hypothetical protein LTR36_001865 [Oleoguttula mirabilis]